MRARKFLVIEDPNNSGRLFYRREEIGIERWLNPAAEAILVKAVGLPNNLRFASLVIRFRDANLMG